MKSRVVLNLISQMTIESDWSDSSLEELEKLFLNGISDRDSLCFYIKVNGQKRFFMKAEFSDFFFETNDDSF